MAGTVAIGLIGALAVRGGDDDRASPSASAAPPPAETRKTAKQGQAKRGPAGPPRSLCTVNTAPTRLGDSAWVAVQPSFAQVPSLERVAIGYAQSKVYGVGITIDPVTLDKDHVFRQYRPGKQLASVTPTTAADTLKFALARDADRFQSAAVVNAPRPYRLGLSPKGISRRYVDGRDTELIWPLETKSITTPRTAELPGFGQAATFRSGGTAGSVRLGWLDASGDAASELFSVAVNRKYLGTPSVAENGKRVLLTFAARGVSEDAWSVHLSLANKGQKPNAVATLDLPPGGPGKNAISPVATGLPDGRWLIQWTEGASGNRRVRGQVLDSTLKPVSEPVALSDAAVNAGQGALWARGETVVSLFLVRNGRGHELWATSLTCKRTETPLGAGESR